MATYFFKRLNFLPGRRSLQTAVLSGVALLGVLAAANFGWCDEPVQSDKSVDESGQKESQPASESKKDAAGQDAARQDTVKQDSAGQDAAKQDTVKQDSAGQDAAKQDTVKQDSAGQDAAKQTSAKPDSDEVQPVKTQSPAAQPSGHLTTAVMRLSGSMCMACLKELENRLKEIKGVGKVKIEYPFQNYYEYYAAPGASSVARATIIFDPALTSMLDIKAFMRIQGYHPYKIVEKDK